MKYLLRPSKLEEAKELTLMSKNAFHTDVDFGGEANDGPPDYDNIKWHQKMIKENHMFSLIVDEKLVGGAVLFQSDDCLHIGRIFIDPKRMREGFGVRLMEMIEYVYKVSVIKLETPIWNVRTNRLYKKCGYVEVSRDSECINYEKELNK